MSYSIAETRAADRRPPVGRMPSGRARDVDVPPPSKRDTPPKSVRLRPVWHRRTGWAILLSAVLVAVLNDVPLFGGRSILPFGHSELYLSLALVIGGMSTRLFGWFDRPE